MMTDHRDYKIQAITQDLIRTAALPLERATTLRPDAYTDEDYFHYERETVLETGWICLAHQSQLEGVGSFIALDLFDEPLMVIRDRTERIRVLSRVCAHRSMDLMPEGCGFPRQGQARTLVCPYHSWTYNLDGTLRAAEEMHHCAGFDPAGVRLPEFRTALWNGFVFVNLDGRAPALDDQYAAFDRVIAPWNPAEMEVAIELSWECEFNWKVMIENWMESYHHIGAHLRTLNMNTPGPLTWSDPEHSGYVHAHLPFTDAYRAALHEARAGTRKMPGFSPIPGLTNAQAGEWGLFLGYPCFMFLTMHDRVLWYRLQPVSAGRCKLLTTTLVSKAAKVAAEYAAALETETEMLSAFHREDMVVNAGVQKGLRSRKAARGRLSHLEEPIWLIQRYLAARARNAYPREAVRAPYHQPKRALVAAQ